MKMSEKFAFVKEIEDKDFLDHFDDEYRSFYERCVDIEKEFEKGPGTCVRESRTMSESIMKYLYYRLYGKKWTGDACDLLTDKDFQKKVHNSTLIDAAHRIRKYGNTQVHEDEEIQSAIDLKQTAKTTLEDLSYVIRTSVEIMEQKGFNQNTENKQTRIQGKVIIKQEKSKKSGNDILKADVFDANFQLFDKEKKNQFQWTVLAKGKNKKYSFKGGRILELREKNYGRRFVCSITREGMSGSISNADEPFEVKKKEAPGKKAPEKEAPEKKAPEKEARKQDVKVPKTEKETAKRESPKRTNTKTGDDRNIQRPALSCAVRKMQKEEAEFFTSASLVHYFLRPDDYFALNSLELVTADVYLYRLLKNSRFEYVYFVEPEGAGCTVYTYDGPSEMAFAQRKGFTEKGCAAECSGRRPTGHFSMEAEAGMAFAAAVKNALNDKEHKTAVVMPLRFLGKDGCCTAEVMESFGTLVKYNETDNVLLLTLTGKINFLECFEGKQMQLHDWAVRVLDEAGPQDADKRLRVAVDLLLKCGRLVIANEYGTDEFANLLFRKILIEKNQGLAQIGAAKVFALAESMHDYLMNQNTQESYDNLKKTSGNVLRELNWQLDKENVIQEVVKKASEMHAVRIGCTDKLHALQVERVYHNSCDNKPREKEQAWRLVSIRKAQMEEIPLPYALEEKDSDKLQKETDSSVLYIMTEYGQGTGFLIHPDGYALTCSHVVKDAKDITARVRIKGRPGGDDSMHKCTVINCKEDLDLAVLKLEGNNFPYLPLAKKERTIKKGEHFLLSGYPFGKMTEQGLTTFQGTVAASGEHKGGAQFVRYLLDSEAKSGNSGSPVISMADGLVIGILCGSIDARFSEEKTEEINFMYPAYYFWEEFVK